MADPKKSYVKFSCLQRNKRAKFSPKNIEYIFLLGHLKHGNGISDHFLTSSFLANVQQNFSTCNNKYQMHDMHALST